jgi:hypothetical protein
MVLWLVLVPECRLPVKPAADYVVHGQQVSLPARQDALSGVPGGLAASDLGFRPCVVRRNPLQQIFKWLEDEGGIFTSPMAKVRPPMSPGKPVPVLPDDDVRRLIDSECRSSARGRSVAVAG